jgi:dTDP-glucose 4,6-dehydratase
MYKVVIYKGKIIIGFNMKIAYVTGCLGFIGRHVTQLLLDKGWYVYGIDNCTYASDTNFLKCFQSYKNFNFERKNICDIDRLVDCDYFINIAAETHVDNSIRDSKVFVESNINGVHNILELLKIYKKEGYVVPRFIHFSTDEVYGDISSGKHIETDILKPSNPYSATKAAADQLIIAWSRTYGIPYNIIRPTNNYGVGQYVEKLIPKACKFIGLGRRIPLHNQGTPIRNWLHAKDTASAVLKIIEYGAQNEIYNVAGGFEQSNIDTIRKVLNSYFNDDIDDYKEYIDFGVERPGQDVRYALNDDKIRSLGWRPECNFDDEIKVIVDYYKNNFMW